MNQMKELYQKVAADPALQQRFASILNESETIGTEATEAKMIDFAKEAGFSVSIAEAKEFFVNLEKASNQSDGLSEEELDLVAGGKSYNGKWNLFASIGFFVNCIVMSIAAEASNGPGGCTEHFQ